MPAYELLVYDRAGNEETLAVLICDQLIVSDDESRAQAETFLERNVSEEAKERWLQCGAKVRET